MNCIICLTEFEHDTYGENNTCPKCGQRYRWDEAQQIVLSEAQLALLRCAVQQTSAPSWSQFAPLERCKKCGYIYSAFLDHQCNAVNQKEP